MATRHAQIGNRHGHAPADEIKAVIRNCSASNGDGQKINQVPDRLIRLDSMLQSTLKTATTVRDRLSQCLRPQSDMATAIGNQTGPKEQLADITVDLDEKIYVVDQIQTILNDVLSRLEV